VAFVPRNHEVLEFIRRVKAGRPARPRPAAPAEARQPVEPFLPIVVREQFALMPRLESLAVVKGEHVCTNEDVIRNAALQLVADDCRGLRVHQARLQGGDASSDSYCFVE
jgi:3-oxoacyl-[acyl-carrier-protein] synthase-3